MWKLRIAKAEHIDLGIFRDTFIWAPLFVERLYESSETGSLSVVPKMDPLECLVSERPLAFATISVFVVSEYEAMDGIGHQTQVEPLSFLEENCVGGLMEGVLTC